MRQYEFQERHGKQWDRLEQLVKKLESPSWRRQLAPEEYLALPDLYRDLCQHLSIAQSRCYSPALIEELQNLALRAHHQLYRREFRIGRSILDFFGNTFPRALRRNAGLFWFAFALFFGPATLFGIACFLNPDLIYSMLDEQSVASMEYMYSTDREHSLGRTEENETASKVSMFGFYIANNTGIGFRTFAGGMLAGVGTLFFLIFNGLVIGGVAGHLSQLGFGTKFWSFVIGHGSFELIAIAISGTAGLLLAKAMLMPGNLSRIDSLKQSAREAVLLIGGAALMFLIAAAIEAFWSPVAAVSESVKYAVGALLWLIVALYLYFAGRNSGAA